MALSNPQLSLKVRIFPGYTPATYTTSLVGTDITSYVRLEEGVTFNRGAQDETSFPSAGRLTLTLNNRDYRFTPDNTSSSLFPNFKNKMPIRVERAAASSVNASAISVSLGSIVKYTVSAGHGIVTGQSIVIAGATNANNNGTFSVWATSATSVTVSNFSGVAEATTSATLTPLATAYTGFVETIEEHWNGGIQPVVVVSASDRLAVLARQTLTDTLTALQIADGAAAIYPLNDEAGSTVSADASGNGYPSLRRATYGVTTTATVQSQNFVTGQFGSDPDSNALTLTRHSSTIGYYMTCQPSIASKSSGAVEGFFYLPGGAMAGVLFRIESPFNAYEVRGNSQPTMVSTDLSTGTATTRITPSASTGILIDDYKWHHVALTWSNTASTTTWTLYVDAVSQGTWAESIASGPAVVQLSVGGGDPATPMTCWVAGVALYSATLSTADITDHALAVGGFTESTSARFTRLTTLSGVAGTATGTPASTMGAQPTQGVNMVDLLQQINDAEDGAIYLDASGVVQYVSQNNRDTLAGVISLDPKYLSPSTTIMRAPASVNTVIASRAGASRSITVQDSTSVTENGVMSESISLYVSNDADLRTVARRRFYRRSTQQPRIGNVVVNLTTATAVNEALIGADIGAYLSIGPLPRGNVDTLLVRIEGISDSITPDSWTRTFNTSPAFKSKDGTTWTLGTSTLDYTTTLA